MRICWLNLIKEDTLSKSHRKVFASLTKYSFIEIDDIIKCCKDDDLGIDHRSHLKKSDFCTYFISAQDFREKIAKKNLIRIHRNEPYKEPIKGIPQGTPLSAFLANLYLLEFDKFIIENLVRNYQCFYRRYSDDIAIVFDNMQMFEEWDEIIRTKISAHPFYLKINPSKTVISQFSKDNKNIHCLTKTELCKTFSDKHPLKYLGFEYDGKTIRIKTSSISKFYRNMKMAVRYKARKATVAKNSNKRFPKRKRKDTTLHLTRLYTRFTHLGKNKSKSNYLTYLDRSANVIYSNLKGNSNPIKKQISRAWSIYNKTFKRYNN